VKNCSMRSSLGVTVIYASFPSILVSKQWIRSVWEHYIFLKMIYLPF